jgi:hypothetical protein
MPIPMAKEPFVQGLGQDTIGECKKKKPSHPLRGPLLRNFVQEIILSKPFANRTPSRLCVRLLLSTVAKKSNAGLTPPSFHFHRSHRPSVPMSYREHRSGVY